MVRPSALQFDYGIHPIDRLVYAFEELRSLSPQWPELRRPAGRGGGGGRWPPARSSNVSPAARKGAWAWLSRRHQPGLEEAPCKLRSARAAGHGVRTRPGSVRRAASTSRRSSWWQAKATKAAGRTTRSGQLERRSRRIQDCRSPRSRDLRPRRRQRRPWRRPGTPGRLATAPCGRDLSAQRALQPSRPAARRPSRRCHDPRVIGSDRSSVRRSSWSSWRSSAT